MAKKRESVEEIHQYLLSKLRAVYAKDPFVINNVLKYLQVVDYDDNFVTIINKRSELETYIQETKTLLNDIDILLKNHLGDKTTFGIRLENKQDKTEEKNPFEDLDVSLAGQLPKNFVFENYLNVNFNSQCFFWAKSVNLDAVSYSPVYIYGNNGLGKTHLAVSLAHRLNKERAGNSLYLPANQFPPYIAHKLKQNNPQEMSKISTRLKTVPLLIFDDFQSYTFGEKIATLNFVFNILEYRINFDKLTVFIADRDLSELASSLEKRLSTRLDSSLKIEIKNPTNEDLISLFKFKLKMMQLHPENWEQASIDFVLRNFSDSIRSLEGAIKAINFYKSTTKDIGEIESYPLAVVKDIFDNIKVDDIQVTPKRIIELVGEYYHIPKSKILSRSRNKDVVLARDIAIYLLRNLLELSQQKIGEEFGGRTHSTVIASLRRVEKKILNDSKNMHKTIDTLKTKIKQPS